MKSEVYIGVNGIGKTKELKKQNDNLSKEQKNIFLIQYSNKESAPDSNVLTNKNIVFDQFGQFIKNLFTFKESIKYTKLNKELQEKFSDKWEKVNSEDKLKIIWNKMLEDPFVDFVRKEKNNDKISTIITSAKKSETEKPDNCDFLIEKRLYDLNLEKWKQATEKAKKGIESYGTGKLSYFQIKFIHSHLELIENKEDSFLIIDEPEVFLHPSLIKKMGFMLKKIGEKINVIIATHSATFLNAFYVPNHTKIYSKKNYSDSKWSEIEIKKPYVFTSRQQCFEALMAKKIIILEGSNDYKLIEYIINNNKLKDYDIYICIAKGKSEITSMINIFKWIIIKKTNEMWHKF